MFTLPEQFSAATKANLDAQLAILSSLTGKAIESVEKVVELNLTVAKTALEESKVTVEKIIGAKDPQDFLSFTTASAQPSADKALAYARHLFAITNSAQSEFAKAAEAHVADTNRKVVAFVDEISKHAPAGSENAVALLKSTISNASAGYDQFNKSAKHAVEVFESNLNSAVNQISQTATKATTRATKKA